MENTNETLFIQEMNALNDSINNLVGTSGKHSISGMREVVDSIELPNPVVEIINSINKNNESFERLFYNRPSVAKLLENVEEITLNSPNLDYMFYSSSDDTITKLPKLTIIWAMKTTKFTYLFYGLKSLEQIEIDFDYQTTGASIDCSNMFRLCENIKEIILNKNREYFYVSNGSYMFLSCANLETIKGKLYFQNSIGNNFFSGCSNLKNIEFAHIGGNANFSQSPLLTIDSLLSAIRAMQSGYTLTIGATNLAKLESVYVDSEGYQVEAGTEGAMLVTDYTYEKGVTLA